PEPAGRRERGGGAAGPRDRGDHARPGRARSAVRAGGLDPRRRAASGSALRYARRPRRDARVHGAGDLRRLRRHGAARDRGREHAPGLRGRALARRPAAADHDLRRSDGVRGEQAARPGHAPGVRRGDECPGLHARAAVLRGAMGAGAGAGDRPPLEPGRGPGWAKLAEAVALRVPPSEIETIYLFAPWKREGREWGTAVGACRGTEGSDRLRVYTARYMLIVRGKERGQSRIEVEETALSPADVIARVMQAAAARTGDPEPPVAVGPAVWYVGSRNQAPRGIPPPPGRAQPAGDAAAVGGGRSGVLRRRAPVGRGGGPARGQASRGRDGHDLSDTRPAGPCRPGQGARLRRGVQAVRAARGRAGARALYLLVVRPGDGVRERSARADDCPARGGGGVPAPPPPAGDLWTVPHLSAGEPFSA